jgi:hypothetical protein
MDTDFFSPNDRAGALDLINTKLVVSSCAESREYAVMLIDILKNGRASDYDAHSERIDRAHDKYNFHWSYGMEKYGNAVLDVLRREMNPFDFTGGHLEAL